MHKNNNHKGFNKKKKIMFL